MWPGSGAAGNLTGGLLPGQTLEHEWAADALAAETHGLGPGFDGSTGMYREPALAPRQEVVSDCFGDLATRDEQAQHLGAEELRGRVRVEGEQVAEGAVWQPAAIGQEHVEKRVPTQNLADGMQEADGPGNNARAHVPGSIAET